MNRIIFCNTGWMRDYRGLRGDPISGGGKHVDRAGYGGEIFNFLGYKGQYYGYVEAWGEINLNRLEPELKKDFLDDVTIVWTARRPSSGGTYIVGWYTNATIFRAVQKAPSASNRRFEDSMFGYVAKSKIENCKLLHLDERLLKVPRGVNGMGQRNIWYAENNKDFTETVRNYIFKGIIPKTRKGSSKGVPRQIDILKRQKIEARAIKIVSKYYKQKGYKITSVEKDNVGWDLNAIFNEIEIKIEVKGLSGPQIVIELTPNEYTHLNKYSDSYRLCVVTDTLTKPKLKIFSYSADIERWADEHNNLLSLEPLTGARARL